MVTTRSQKSKEEDLLSPAQEISKKSYQIQIVPRIFTKSQKRVPPPEEQDEEDSFRQDYYDMIEEESILENPKLKKKLDRILDILLSDSPKLTDILNAKINRRQKADLLEWYFIYVNSMEMSEERRLLKKRIRSLMNHFVHSFVDSADYKEEIQQLEETNKDWNEFHTLQLGILKLQTSMENKNIIYRKFLELRDKENEMDEEYHKMKQWLQHAIRLPYDRVLSFPCIDNITLVLKHVRQTLDQELFGMNKVKEQLLLFFHGKLKSPNIKGCCLGLIGPPGVGKTSIARCLSRILKYPFEQISLGGVHSVDYLRGFDYTYVGSRPGEIVRCLSRMKCKNGIIFFDEYDKISHHSDVTSCLLHVTDFSQNEQFRDHFLTDLTIDLSCLWFIYSMNQYPTDNALRDRVFFIEIEGYSTRDQVRILCDYLLPKHLKNMNLPKESVQIDDQVGEFIVRQCQEKTPEKGVRMIEKALKDILHKLSFLVTNQQEIQCSFLPPSSYFPISFPLSLTNELSKIMLKSFLETSYKSTLSYDHLYL